LIFVLGQRKRAYWSIVKPVGKFINAM